MVRFVIWLLIKIRLVFAGADLQRRLALDVLKSPFPRTRLKLRSQGLLSIWFDWLMAKEAMLCYVTLQRFDLFIYLAI